MKVEKFINNILSSNSYLIHTPFEKDVWVIDPGDSKPLLDWVNVNEKTVKGILLTHSHIDHIYGVNDICGKFPKVEIFVSEFAREGLYSPKMNSSYYLEMPYIIEFDNINPVKEGSEIELNNSGNLAKVLYTPGHNNDCISFQIANYLFTGDALIPGVKVHTKSKKGDKLTAIDSINKILNNYPGDILICPGHREMQLLSLIEIPDLLISNI